VLGAAAMMGTVLWFALLAERPLFDPDEGRYAEIPREMLSGGDWVMPHLDALVYLEKPPLQYWLTALTFRAFGENEFAARLCTGLAGYLSLATVFLLGRKLWGFDAGVRALPFTSASTLFVLLGHQLTLDMLLSFCLTAALGCFLMAQSRRDESWRAWILGCRASYAAVVVFRAGSRGGNHAVAAGGVRSRLAHCCCSYGRRWSGRASCWPSAPSRRSRVCCAAGRSRRSRARAPRGSWGQGRLRLCRNSPPPGSP
jgi:hypothetical protein